MGDYILASYHFKTLYQTFPNHPNAEDAAFMTAFCYYLETPKYSLDQAYTYKAINEIQLFVNTHPGSQRLDECNMLMEELRTKLEEKSFGIAKGYYRTERYQSAVLAFSHTLTDFPDSEHREEAMFLRLDAAYELAMKSISSKQLQRFKEARTAYYDFIDLFPETEYKKDADKIYQKIVLELEKFNVKA
jgi:outer membrane protein assembly factor BamD